VDQPQSYRGGHQVAGSYQHGIILLTLWATVVQRLTFPLDSALVKRTEVSWQFLVCACALTSVPSGEFDSPRRDCASCATYLRGTQSAAPGFSALEMLKKKLFS
jgi:hypothetical protein